MSVIRKRPLSRTRRRPAEGGRTASSDDRKGLKMPRKATEAAATTKKPAARKPTVRRMKKADAVEFTWDHVATRAYYIHLEAGGDPTENWLQAERELITV
jgi:hypothetical protein